MRFFRWSPMLALLLAAPSIANEDWWFDVEVIVFKRSLALTELDEQFELSANLLAPTTDADIISDIITPDISWLKQGLLQCGSTVQPELPEYQLNLDILALSQPDLPAESDAPELELAREAAPTALTADQITDSPLSNTDVDMNAEEAAPIPLTAQDIADLWLEAMGMNDIRSISVPEFSYCEPPTPWLTYHDNTWHIHASDNRLPTPLALPVTPEGNDWPNASHAHLLTQSQQQLASLSRQIRQSKDLTRLLHVTWRQPVKFGKEEAFNVRLFAGKNYASEFNLDGTERQQNDTLYSRLDATISEHLPTDAVTGDGLGHALPLSALDDNTASNEAPIFPPLNTPEAFDDAAEPQGARLISDFFNSLEHALDSPSPIGFDELNALHQRDIIDNANDDDINPALRTPIWQLDGNMKVFLKYINRVPYLHIDSELFYRQPIAIDDTSNPMIKHAGGVSAHTPEYQLVSLPFSEQRRVISKQLHYFDHPLFGMIVQIRRYQRPEPEIAPSP